MQSWSDHAELFRLLVENARDYAIFGLSPEGRILTWNPGAELLLGFSPQEAIGSDTSLIFTPEDKAQGVPEQELIKAAQAGRSVDERWHMRKNGSRFWASGMMFSLKNAEGKSQGFAKIIRDRTEEKRLLARLEEAVEARDEFLAVLAHELRNPLGSLQLNLDTLNQAVRSQTFQEIPPVNLERLVISMSRQLSRLNQLLDRVYDLALIDTQNLQLRMEETDLAELVQQSLLLLEEEIRRYGITLSLSSAGEIRGRWDRVRIQQVICNLVQNACKYAAGGSVSVSISATAEHAVLSVADSGPGIPPEMHSRIFERYHKGQSPALSEGLGLGLHIAREIVLAHQGRLKVQSEAGRGSTFIVELPL